MTNLTCQRRIVKSDLPEYEHVTTVKYVLPEYEHVTSIIFDLPEYEHVTTVKSDHMTVCYGFIINSAQTMRAEELDCDLTRK